MTNIFQMGCNHQLENHQQSNLGWFFVGQDDDALGRMVVESPNGVGESQIVAPGDGYSDAKKRENFLEAILDVQKWYVLIDELWHKPS